MRADGRNRLCTPQMAALGDWLVNALTAPLMTHPGDRPDVTPPAGAKHALRMHPPQGAHALADLHPGTGKTDIRDACVIANAARTM